MKNQLRREIEDILIPELLLAYHTYNHAITRHMDVSHMDLKTRLREKRFLKDEMVPISRFLEEMTLENVAKIIYTNLDANISQVEQWLEGYNGRKQEFIFDFDEVIGDGIVKGTDWNKLFPMSRLCVALDESKLKGRLFRIVSAYPVPNPDEVDIIWDAIDEWTDVQQQKRVDQRKECN